MASPLDESISFANKIAQQCYAKYKELPRTGKPTVKEWTLLAGVVQQDASNNLMLVALGTGSKCIGQSKMSSAGDILNDSHAEVMARRGFLRYLYHQAKLMYKTGHSDIFSLGLNGKCILRKGISYHFFMSHTPCGDASIFPKAVMFSEGIGHCLNNFNERSNKVQDLNTSECKVNSGMESKSGNKDNGNCIKLLLGKGGMKRKKDLNDEVKLNNNCVKRLKGMEEPAENIPCTKDSSSEKDSDLDRLQQDILSVNSRFMSVSSKASISCENKVVGSSKIRDVDEEKLQSCDSRYLQRTVNSASDSHQHKVNQSSDSTAQVHSIIKDIYRTGAKCLPGDHLQDAHTPGINYHCLGALRTKPGRGDPTLSLSCSDKLARWNIVGVQGALLSLLLSEPVCFTSLVVGGGCPFSHSALLRAVAGRVSAPTPILVQATLCFADARPIDGSKQPCPSSIVYCLVPDKPLEVAVAGRKQGATKKISVGRACRLLICKKELFHQFLDVLALSQLDQSPNTRLSYREWKALAKDYQQSWQAVRQVNFPKWIPKPEELQGFTADVA